MTIAAHQSARGLNKLLPFIFTILVICSIAFFFWPGYMSPDSMHQLNQALTGNYSDHHPPMMSFLWKFFNYIYTGPQLFFIFHLLLLFSSMCILQTLIQKTWIKLLTPFILLVPNILAYSGAIWKDTGFAYSFLLAAMILAKSNISSNKLTYPKVVLVISLLIYGVGVKYQGQFVLPIMTLWLGMTFSKQKINLKSIVIGTLTTVFALLFVTSFNNILVPKEKENHSWQMVKLYDLAGIGVRANENLFPDFVKSHKIFSMEKVKEIYSPERVDELIEGWGDNSSLPLTRNEDERELLWKTWADIALKHPIYYLAHRFALWNNMVFKSPIKTVNQLKSFEQVPAKVQFILKNGGGYVLEVIRELSRFAVMLPFLFLYILWGWSLYRKNNPYGIVLLMMNLASLSLLSCLFIFSMASDLRYIYLSTCFVFFSHPIALSALLDRHKSKREKNDKVVPMQEVYQKKAA